MLVAGAKKNIFPYMFICMYICDIFFVIFFNKTEETFSILLVFKFLISFYFNRSNDANIISFLGRLLLAVGAQANKNLKNTSSLDIRRLLTNE